MLDDEFKSLLIAFMITVTLVITLITLCEIADIKSQLKECQKNCVTIENKTYCEVSK